MAGYQKESGTIKGRGFGTVDGVTSFMNAFKAWIVKAHSSGGPAWFIIDDQSALGTDPYIVISDKSTLSNSNRNKVIQVLLPTGTSDRIYFTYWMWWNTSAHTGVATIAKHSITTQENTEYAYDFRGGPETILVMARIGTTWTYTYLTEWTGLTNFIEDESGHTGTLVSWMTETGDNNNQLSGYEALTNVGLNCDADGKMYFSIVGVSGSNIGVNIYKDSARTQLIGHLTAANYTIGQVNSVTADNSSGLGGTLIFNAKVANDSDIVVDFKLVFGSGEGAGFTPGKFYFIWDFSSNTARVNYFKVISVTGDSVVALGLGLTTTSGVFAAGAIASPYGHRWFISGSNVVSPYSSASQMPYRSKLHGGILVINDASQSVSSSYDYLLAMLQSMNPDDEGRYTVMKPIVYESNENFESFQSTPTATKPNKAYGTLKNTYLTSSFGLAVMQDGRVIASKNYLTMSTFGSNIAQLFLDSTSLS